MPLIPGTSHIVRWTKQNLLDTATYYPYAIIRDTRTDTILDEFALDNLGDDIRYSKAWNVVQDGTGQGRQIEIEITIYENSGHTVASGIYGRWAETFLVLQLQSGQNGGASGSQIDYRLLGDLIARKVREELAALSKGEKPSYSSLEAALAGVEEALNGHGERAGELKDHAESIASAQEEMRQTIETFQKNVTTEIVPTVVREINDAATAAMRDIRAAADTHAQAVRAVGEESKVAIAQHTDQELEHIVGQFKTIMDEKAKTISAALIAGIEDVVGRFRLSKTTEEFDVREPEAKVEKDTRGRHFLTYE